jgi:hypothetical protein
MGWYLRRGSVPAAMIGPPSGPPIPRSRWFAWWFAFARVTQKRPTLNHAIASAMHGYELCTVPNFSAGGRPKQATDSVPNRDAECLLDGIGAMAHQPA